jgi:hypothetical protein
MDMIAKQRINLDIQGVGDALSAETKPITSLAVAATLPVAAKAADESRDHAESELQKYATN